MDAALYVLCAAGFMFFCALIAQGFKEPKSGMHRFAYSKETPEMAEHKYNRVRNFQQICMWAGLALILAAAATFIIPRWDNIQRNLNNGTQTSRLILPQEAGITLAFFISIDNEVGES